MLALSCGRSERYIKDEPTLEDYLLDHALKNLSVTPESSPAPLNMPPAKS